MLSGAAAKAWWGNCCYNLQVVCALTTPLRDSAPRLKSPGEALQGEMRRSVGRSFGYVSQSVRTAEGKAGRRAGRQAGKPDRQARARVELLRPTRTKVSQPVTIHSGQAETTRTTTTTSE